MSQQDFFENDPQEELSVDELIRSTKAALDMGPEAETLPEEPKEAPEMPPLFQPSLPAEYADLVSEEESEEQIEEEERRGAIPSVIKGLLYVCCVMAAAILLAVFAWKCIDDVCALTDTDSVVTVTVPESASMSQITETLAEKGLIKYKWLFSLYCMISNAEEKIDPGTYELNAVFDYHALVYGMIETSENRATVEVTIPEGYEAEDIFRLLEEKQVCTVEKLKEAAAGYEFEYWFLEGLEYGDYRRLEGYLFPDTYEFYVDDTPENVLSRFLRNFDNKVTEEMQTDLAALNEELQAGMEANGFTQQEIQQAQLTFHDVVIVASLVEKEATNLSESGKVASVVYNRLSSKLYPCLNMDATIQYVLPERKEILTNADKAVISPYNTYTNAGLPVGPIANPGMSSLRAALYPVESDYYFYALDPANGLHFSSNVYDHQVFLDSLLGALEPAVTEDAAVAIAVEEAKDEKYDYAGSDSDFSHVAYTELLETKEDLQSHLWEETWAVLDMAGAPLYTGQMVWSVELTDTNDPLTHLLIYVDASNGSVVGAGKLSD